ncbi:MAG: two-component system, NtrC family, sensor kinase, partial [Verrucomicrobiota bacterium]
MMLTSSIVLLLACAAFTTYDVLIFRRDLVESVSILAEAIGNNCAAAIDFDDPKSAGETLVALRTDNNIVSACVYSRNGRLFAVYQRDGAAAFVPPAMQSSGQQFTRNQLHLFRPIKQRNETTGMIFVASDLKDLSARLMRYIGIVGLVFLVSLVVGLALSSKLQRLVADPILQLAQVARSVALEKNYSVRAAKQSNDELGELADGFNEMLAQIQERDLGLQAARDNLERRVDERTRELEATHKQLVEASRRGGMAEIATNVLHNVGNVLNSVNVSASVVTESVKTSKASSLAKVAGLLREHEQDLGTFITSDPQGKQLPAYLGQLSAHLLAEQEATLLELDLLRRNVEHIKEIVAMQQSYATFGGVKEMIDVVSLVEDSMRMNEGALSRHGVEVIREFENLPPMNVDKHKVLQI